MGLQPAGNSNDHHLHLVTFALVNGASVSLFEMPDVDSYNNNNNDEAYE